MRMQYGERCAERTYAHGGSPFALLNITLHEISEPNPFGLKYAICPVIRLDNADFEFEA